MAVIKDHDFIEVEYTGRLKEDNSVFDTTSADIAKKSSMYNEKASYGPVVVCIGEGHLLKGINRRIVGKEAGKEYDFELSAEEAFGKKDAKLIQLIPTNKFKQNKVMPFPGLQVNIDGLLGTIKTVSGGRTLVDFNHPLAGKEVLYKVKVNRIIDDDKEKLLAMLKLVLGHEEGDFNIEINEGTAKISFKHDIPEEIKKGLEEDIMKLIPSLKKIVFTTEEEKKQRENK